MAIDRLILEKQLWGEGYTHIMGLDEAGRGCLAGPVVAAGVILHPGFDNENIKDSKKLPEKERRLLADFIKREAICYVIAEGSLKEIEQLNILWASLHTMEKCVLTAEVEPDYLLVDGNRFIPTLLPHSCIVKGDDLSMSIGAASILAKVYRDELMKKLGGNYPEFGWGNNVGYPTKAHRKALIKYGYTKHHRMSFNLGTQKKYKEKNS